MKAFNKIWILHYKLYYFCLYKPFINENWEEIYTYYYLFSNFIQNLKEDNFYYFKVFFAITNYNDKINIDVANDDFTLMNNNDSKSLVKDDKN